jgi:hypothetical protein
MKKGSIDHAHNPIAGQSVAFHDTGQNFGRNTAAFLHLHGQTRCAPFLIVNNDAILSIARLDNLSIHVA